MPILPLFKIKCDICGWVKSFPAYDYNRTTVYYEFPEPVEIHWRDDGKKAQGVFMASCTMEEFLAPAMNTKPEPVFKEHIWNLHDRVIYCPNCSKRKLKKGDDGE